MTMYKVISMIVQSNIDEIYNPHNEREQLFIYPILTSYSDYDGSIYVITMYKITTRSRIFIGKLIREKHGVLL